MTKHLSAAPIEFYNRYTGQIETEKIYGENWLRWAYQKPAGRASVELIAKHAWFSKWYGWQMSLPGSRSLIGSFIEKYDVDTSEFADPDTFRSFNEFFSRELKAEARPVDANPDSVVFPADGRHLGIQDLSTTDGFFVKGQHLNLSRLLGDLDLAKRFASGTAVLSRLCPVDYHRFHFCTKGTPSAPQPIDGQLYSVSPVALRRRLDFLVQNKRVLTQLSTEDLGRIAIVEIGATNVGSIVQQFTANQVVAKGQLKGWFEFGGSAVLTLFEPGAIMLADDLLEHSSEHREVYAKMGDSLGECTGMKLTEQPDT